MRDLRTIVLTNTDADEAKRLLANMEAGRPATTNDPSEEFGGSHTRHTTCEGWREFYGGLDDFEGFIDRDISMNY